jgi:ubiquinone/menaquinone biosynthesis C-methylase UbiE
MNTEITKREESFHDTWASSVDIGSILVNESFESCTTPEARQIVEWLGDVRGKTLLDLGSGLGEGAVYFAKRGAIVTAADLSGEMLDVVSRLGTLHNVNVTTQKCTAELIPLPDNTFDIVYCGNLLHHVNVSSTLKETKRVLKPGGMLVTWDPLVHNPIIQLYRRIAQDVRTDDEHPLKMSELELFRKEFSTVKYECYWLFTLWIFIRFLLIERVNPNKERYWKKIVLEHKRLNPIYTKLEKLDKFFLTRFPWMKRYCWNIVISCVK